MTINTYYKEKISRDGFAVINDVFSPDEITKVINYISKADSSKPTFRKSNNLFAIRKFLTY